MWFLEVFPTDKVIGGMPFQLLDDVIHVTAFDAVGGTQETDSLLEFGGTFHLNGTIANLIQNN